MPRVQVTTLWGVTLKVEEAHLANPVGERPIAVRVEVDHGSGL